MGAFEYTALDSSGKERTGILEGDTPRHIRQLLRERQLLPVSVSEVAQKEAKRRSFSLARGVSPGDLAARLTVRIDVQQAALDHGSQHQHLQ